MLTEQDKIRFFQLAMEKDADPVYWIGPDARLRYANEAACGALGYSREELLARTIFDIDAVLTPAIWSMLWANIQRTGFGIRQSMHRRKDGSTFPVEVTANYIRDADEELCCARAHDMTEHVRTLEALRFERSQLLSIFDAVPAIVDVVDMETHEILYMNKYCQDLFGGNHVGELCYKVFHGYDRPCEFCTDAILRRDKDKPHSWEYFSETLNRHFMTTNRTIKWPDGRDVKFEHSIDVTERVRANRELQRLAAAVHAAAESIIVTDPQGRIQYVNPAYEKVTGYALNEVIGKTTSILKSGRHDAKFYADMWAVLTRGEHWRGRFTNRRKDGTLFEEDAVISPVLDSSGAIVNYVAVKRDITQQAALESQLRQSQRMEAIGRLAEGIAHEFTNMLTVISGNAKIAADRVRASTGAPNEELAAILSASRRLTSLTGDLLALAHRSQVQLRNVDLNKAVRGIEGLLRATMHSAARIFIHEAGTRLPVRVDMALMEQAILHLAVYARDSMPEGGDILLEASSAFFSPAETVQFRGAPGEDACACGAFATLSVSDSGPGVNHETMAHIFDPFFSPRTGVRQQESGLGLSTAYGIVRQHDGYITVYSVPGQGTTFTIFLPMLEGKGTPAALPEFPRGPETVLVAEDELLVRTVLVRILVQLGYTVLEAEDGKQCMELAGMHRESVRLLLTDVSLRGEDGRTLAAAVKTVCGNAKYLFSSGYPEFLLRECGWLRENDLFVAKPYSTRSVAEAVRRALDA